MKKNILILFCFIFGLDILCNANEIKIYSQNQFDEASRRVYRPGDVIMLKRGERFKGMLAPKGKGTSKAPIKISTFGKGDRPRIDAGGKLAGVYLENPSYWEVDGLEITNTNGSDKDQGNIFGIYVRAIREEGKYKHVYISNCYIHDINGKVAGKLRGGIHVHVEGLKKSRFDDLKITNNRIVRVGGVGIGNSSSCGDIEFEKDKTIGKNLWTDVYVADNYIDRTGRNCIIARCSKDAVYERNILANSSRYDTGHSIFCFDTDGIKIQYNEAYGNIGKEGKDRGGFDADYNCVNTYIQYNYSHDNMWFCGIMKKQNRNVVIRYNISQNERHGLYFYGFEKNKEAENIHIYNNTHFISKDLDVRVFPEQRTPINTLFENNIFYFESRRKNRTRGKWGHKERWKGKNVTFNNNIYFNITPHPSDKKAITFNPLFMDPGKAGKNINLKTMEALKGYELKLASPAIDKGAYIKNNGKQDILKNRLIEKPDIGACEK